MANNETTRVVNGKKASDDSKMPLGKINFVLIAVSLLLIVVGFILMSGSGNTGEEFNYSIFESRRTVVAPMVTFLGFILMAPAIMWRGKKDNDLSTEENAD